MASQPSTDRPRLYINRTLIRLAMLVGTSLMVMASLVLPIAMRPSSYPLKIGDVVQQDINAPQTLSFVSDLETEKARQGAVDKVEPVYTSPDPGITRQQIEKLRAALNFISVVRQDNFSSPNQKISDLSLIAEIQLPRTTAERIINLTDSRWQTIKAEAISVLEQTLRETVREDRLEVIRFNLLSRVSLSIPQEQASVVVDLVSTFVIANSLFDPEKTESLRQEALTSIKQVERSFVAGERIVLRGQVINGEDWEALQQFGLIKPRNNTSDITAALILVVTLSAFIALYFYRRRTSPPDRLKGLALISITFVVFIFGARFLIPNRVVLPYVFPIPAFGLALASLFNAEIGLVLSLVMSILAAYGLPNSLDLSFFYIISSFCGILALGRAHRMSAFLWAGLTIGISGTAMVFAFRLADPITDWIGLATLSGAAFLNGVGSASITLLYQFLFSQLLGLTTTLQLMESSRPDHPLLQFILRNAPGTYQHSLQVANLAEQAAETIGADALLVRVGAIYHDAGKALNPQFFIENQVPGKLDPHEDLDSATVAATIIQHVPDGLQLARKYNLPARIQNFISEHHGTFLTRYQYTRAVEAAGNQPDKVDQELFRYPGPEPQSRETALLMLADNTEARARSELPKNEDELRELVKRVIEYCQKEGQLDATHLTLRDLRLITDSFVRTLQGSYHPRIRYPELKTPAIARIAQARKNITQTNHEPASEK